MNPPPGKEIRLMLMRIDKEIQLLGSILDKEQYAELYDAFDTLYGTFEDMPWIIQQNETRRCENCEYNYPHPSTPDTFRCRIDDKDRPDNLTVFNCPAVIDAGF